MIKRFATLLACCFVLQPASAQEAETFSDRIRAAMESEVRTVEDTDRDANRLPVETLEFFGVDNGMKVLELIPGRGWYTKLLAPALRDNGEYFASIGTSRIEGSLVAEEGFDHIQLLKPELVSERDEALGQTSLQPFSFGETGFDVVLTFRNQHNFTEEGRRAINEAAFEALRPGGVYGVVDHTRRHMEPQWSENRRRIDPVVVIKEVLDAGFELEGFSDLHRRQDDELRYEVGSKTVTGNTDRFTLKFRKPE